MISSPSMPSEFLVWGDLYNWKKINTLLHVSQYQLVRFFLFHQQYSQTQRRCDNHTPLYMPISLLIVPSTYEFPIRVQRGRMLTFGVCQIPLRSPFNKGGRGDLLKVWPLLGTFLESPAKTCMPYEISHSVKSRLRSSMVPVLARPSLRAL